MRYLVMSDIHANLLALEAVLADAPGHDEVICLGDVVGYGPDPNLCVERVRELPCTCLAGNHDWAVLGKLDLSHFNRDARAANAWTQRNLTRESAEFLRDLPIRAELPELAIVHASPREPVWEYVLDTRTARANFDHFTTPVCLVGHSHRPLIFILDGEGGQCVGGVLGPRDQVSLDDQRVILNPGSVGQPRDGDPRASYAILDCAAWTWRVHRVAYPVESTQQRMVDNGLPAHLIDRLAIGY